MAGMDNFELILTLPAASVPSFAGDGTATGGAFATSDPPGRQLGSGGGTVAALLDAWRHAGSPDWKGWIAASPKVLIHGSGQSRRLPGYAVEGKPLLPLPLLPSATAQRPGQTLLGLQAQTCGRLLWNAPAGYCVGIACGDVLVTADGPLPVCPAADVLIAGLPSTPEEASHHGVMFCHADDPTRLRLFLQKPSPDRIRELSATHAAFLDTGLWLLGPRALDALLRCSGIDPDAIRAGSDPGPVSPCDLFDRFATALGEQPSRKDPELAGLTAAVLPLPAGRFLHFGTNRSVLSSVARLAAGPDPDGTGGGHAPTCMACASRVEACPNGRGPDLWIDASDIPATWHLPGRHVLTGIPPNRWELSLPAGACLDAVALRDAAGLCWRAYGFDDPFRGPAGDPATLWQGRPFPDWLSVRGIAAADAGIAPETDLHDARIHPVLAADDPRCGRLLAWILAEDPAPDRELADLWLSLPRLSSAELLVRGDPSARQAVRREREAELFGGLGAAGWAASCARLDLGNMARLVSSGAFPAPPELPSGTLAAVHDAIFRQRAGLAAAETAAERLGRLLVGSLGLRPALPRRAVLEDQIVWGRAPARIDLAGGWTDTPPYCLEHGGSVVNLALDLNGQPPIQAFARICPEPRIVLRSIDLGVSETVESMDDLLAPARLGGAFGIPRAALRLAGFDPLFRGGASGSVGLREWLRETFGGGVELTILAAIPKGSGLGTSSILSATVLGTLSDLCGLHWGVEELTARTLALEQLLTAGGGWQDQVGGATGGVKLVASAPGIVQRPTVRWLPSTLLEEAIADRRLLLYYTGITRVAHDILGEIVNGLFLNDPRTMGLVEEIGRNAAFAADALQRRDWDGLCEAVRRSWRLNCALDAGTNPPAVQGILDRAAPWISAAKLAGAGGGGYLLFLAKDADSGRRLRREFEGAPPNPRARFVEPSLSATGFQATRS